VKVPKGSDEKVVTKLNNVFDESAATKSPYFIRNRRSPLEFTIKHFAGDVSYTAVGFLEKNKDALPESLLKLLATSTSLPILVTNIEDSSALGSEGEEKKKADNRLTLAAKFKNDLDSLMTALRATSPHFIRCIKPNNEQAANKFDAHLVLNQLKYSGLFEAVRIRKVGFPIRIEHIHFIKRYKFAASVYAREPPSIRSDPRAHCTWIAAELTKALVAAEEGKSKMEASKGAKPPPLPPGRGVLPPPKWTAAEVTRQCFVGKTKVFLRSQYLKNSFDQLRSMSSKHAAVPIQSCFRGFLARKKYRAELRARYHLLEQSRRYEAYERGLMKIEDDLSAQFERLVQSDENLQNKMKAVKLERGRREALRRQAQQFEASRTIQKIVRGVIYRQRGRLLMCERFLEKALRERNDQQLRRAIDLPLKYRVTSKLIKLYQESARKLMLEVLNESYVQNQLNDAIELQSIELLRDAIHLAEQSNMSYVKGLRKAKIALENGLFLRSICSTIASVLVRCTTVPKLLAKVDILRFLLERANRYGLAHEARVQEAAFRVGRMRNLIALRDQIRFAVEICCPSQMRRCALAPYMRCLCLSSSYLCIILTSSLRERSKLLSIYGDELMEAELAAVNGMIRMVNYQRRLQESEGKALNPQKQTDAKDDHEEDVFLPPFVRSPLEEIRSAKSSLGYQLL
jgi:hypothetical protein